jgi:hypothetical protein
MARIKTQNLRTKVQKLSREKHQLTYKDRNIIITSDLSAQTLKASKAWSNIIQTLTENNCQPRTVCSAKLSFNLDKELRTFKDKDKLKWFMQCMRYSGKACCTKVTQGNKSHGRG